MRVYTYDPIERIPTGSWDCQPDPMEPGSFITPTHALPHPPPTPGPNQIVKYSDDKDDWILVTTPIPTPDELLKQQIDAYMVAMRKHLSSVAQKQKERFNSISEAKSYAGADNKLKAISQAMTVWAADVHDAAVTTLEKVESKEIPLPSLDAFINSLPKWVRPT